MADIRPFKCIHPSEVYADRVAALPYDVYSRDEARAEAHKDPLSFLNIDRPETQFPEGYDMYAPEVYEKAAAMIAQERLDGVFVQDGKPVYWIYELTMDGRTQTGLVACASIDDYLDGTIRKHENTRAEKEADRIRHVDTCNMQTGPIFLAYRAQSEIESIIDRVKGQDPRFDFTGNDGITHRGWIVDDEREISLLQQAFDKIGRIYIADGHHRAASAVKVGCMRREANPGYTGEEEFNYFLCVLFPDSELKIMDYNRYVKDLNGMTAPEFLEKLAPLMRVEKTGEFVRPKAKGDVAMYLDGAWYALSIHPHHRDPHPVKGLDVSLLQDLVLSPLLGIEDPKVDQRIAFIGGIRGHRELQAKVDEGGGVAFAMYPTSMEELMRVADENELMPPKSTWFEPKLRSGLFLHELG